jgi:hypothetical protein
LVWWDLSKKGREKFKVSGSKFKGVALGIAEAYRH